VVAPISIKNMVFHMMGTYNQLVGNAYNCICYICEITGHIEATDTLKKSCFSIADSTVLADPVYHGLDFRVDIAH
jgi:hypothetical protein